MLQAYILCSIYLLNICSQNKMKHNNNNNNNVALWYVVNLRFSKTILELVPQNDDFPALLRGSLSPACIIIVQLSVVVLKLWGRSTRGVESYFTEERKTRMKKCGVDLRSWIKLFHVGTIN